MVRILLLVTIISLFSGTLPAQDTLPKFSVTTKGNNRVFINWTNNFRAVSQISIQRSIDSLKNFKTILTVPDASIPQNGFVDTKAATPFMFYRLFIVLDSGKYEFSASKKPLWDTSKNSIRIFSEKNPLAGSKREVFADNLSISESKKLRDKINGQNELNKDSLGLKPAIEKFFIIKRRDSILFQIAEKNFKSFRDSIVYKSKDTLVFRSIDTILIKPFVPKEVFKASLYVFTEKDGNVSISLQDASTKNYSVKFFDEKNNLLFEITKVKESSLIIDKANFLHAGWFRFELYEEATLKEKNKFFITKDF